MKDIFERDINGELISEDDPEFEKIYNIMIDTMKLASKLNTSLLDFDENRKILTQIFGREYDKSSTILPPFYVDFGKNIKLGKNVWVQQNCTFFDRGGITIGNNVYIAPRVSLMTLSHPLDPAIRAGSISKPIVVEDNVWIGIGATILQGVTIGKNSVVGAHAVVSKDVPPNSVVAGNPAKVIKTL